MKTKVLLFLAGISAITSVVSATKVTITNNGSWFVPNEITVEPGDTIIFNIASTHDAVEVSKETWDANGNTPNGGFSLNFGGGQLIMDTPGVHYYVCTPHATWGMKGTITVSGITGIGNIPLENDNSSEMKAVYPNPFSDRLTLLIGLPEPSFVTIQLLDMIGNIIGPILRKEMHAGEQTEMLDLSGLKPGQYLLRYISNREDHSQTLVKL